MSKQFWKQPREAASKYKMNKEYSKFLSPDEKIVKVLGIATSQFVWDLFWSIILLPVLIGFYFLIAAIYRKLTIRYLISDKRVIVKTGLIGQSTVSANYNKITDITVRQGIIGRVLLHTGTIFLDTAGSDEKEVVLEWINNPFEVKNFIYERLPKK